MATLHTLSVRRCAEDNEQLMKLYKNEVCGEAADKKYENWTLIRQNTLMQR